MILEPNRPDEREAAMAKLDVVADALQVACGKFDSPHGVDLAQWSIDVRDAISVLRRDAPREGASVEDAKHLPRADPEVATLTDLYWHITRNALSDGSRFAVLCMGALPALDEAIAAPDRAPREGGEAVAWERVDPAGIEPRDVMLDGVEADYWRDRGYTMHPLVYGDHHEVESSRSENERLQAELAALRAEVCVLKGSLEGLSAANAHHSARCEGLRNSIKKSLDYLLDDKKMTTSKIRQEAGIATLQLALEKTEDE